jgi:hypothetical protein|tara:strand:+ start:701 stop:856 length:156 start_codon:yes stop_codon:yes gene_type:complete
MKVGDLVKYYGTTLTGLVLYINKEGGTLKVLSSGEIKWYVTSGCKVISESR